jgi:uncharacterized membrane protein
MSVSKSRRVLIASLAGALSLPAVAGSQDKPGAQASGEKVKCYGVNKCKQTGDCGGPGHTCANQNSCKRQGYIEMDKETCLRIDGGRLTADAKPAPSATPAQKKEKKG